ncbi:MAG: PDZ domain-containing protein [Planctomycetia bacterium]|nr:PDZ domain-containing protein [Planctomycetia bacterium]
MKKFIACLFVAGLALLAANTTFAQESSQKMTDEELAKLEAELFVTLDSTDAGSEAKSLKIALGDNDDGTAKCLWWRYRPAYYYYPSYYYYGWYCPVYYVPLRFVTVTLPVRYTVYTYTYGQPVVTNVVGAASEVVAAGDAEVIVKSSGQHVRGAVISKTIPAKSPLAKIGLRAGDIVTKINGKPVTSMADLKKITKNSKVEFVKGNGIKIAAKSMSIQGAKGGDSAGTASVQDIKAEKDVFLYDYFDNLEEDNNDIY